jgi:uncharacterized protein (TIGR02757 family)
MSIHKAHLQRCKVALDKLIDAQDKDIDTNEDPLQVVHRYSHPHDQEIAAVFSAQLAYGRVQLFLPVLNRLMDIADKNGGPRQWIINFRPKDIESLTNINYRWNKYPDFALFALTLQLAIQKHNTIGELFELSYTPQDPTLRLCLDRSVEKLQDYSACVARTLDPKWTNFKDLPASFKRFLSRPAKGSACKRWHLLLRWMVRRVSPDLGIWSLPIAKLLMPMDVHVHRLSILMGLTERKSIDDKAVKELTGQLRKLDPIDPTRYDFALSHLGISGQCQNAFVFDICNNCPLSSVCKHTNS